MQYTMKLLLFLIFSVSIFSTVTNANTYLNKNNTWDSSITASFWTSIAIGDINKDGYSDFVEIGCTLTTGGTSCASFLAKFFINTGTTFVESVAWQSNLTAVHYGSVALGDIDNDGDLDLALSGCKYLGGSVSACPNVGDDFSAIYINNGTSFVESAQWKGDVLNAWKSSFAFGDINLDGKLDIVFSGQSTSYGSIAKVYINNGTAFKENATWQQGLTGVYGSSTTLVDFDNDNDLDLFLIGDTGGSGYTARAYINNGTSFIENSIWEASLMGVELTSSVWGDFDNNGRMDLSYIGHTSSDEHEIFNNTGITLVEINKRDPYGTLAGIFEGTQALGDYNNDGKLDLFTSGEEQYSTLYLNTSASYSEDPEPGIFNTAYGPGAGWSDVDNDGDLDLILIGYNKIPLNDLDKAVYINNITTKNTAPSAPSTLTANYSNGILNLSWNAGSDGETPTAGLYYNLRVGTSSGGNQVVTGVYGGGDDNGYFGNMMQRKNILLNVNLSGTIYWSVQTIDTGLKAGPWATERTYTIQSQDGGQNDTTPPSVSITSPSNGSASTSSSVSISAMYSDASSVICTAKMDSGSSNSMSGGGSTSGTTSYSFTSVANGQHTVYVNCTDTHNNSRINITTFTVNVPATNGGSGGGGGGGAGGSIGSGSPGNASSSNRTTNNTQTVVTSHPGERLDISSGETKAIEFANTVITTASVEVRNTVSNVHIDAVETEKPATLEAPADNVYSYIEINHTNITNSDIKSAILTFGVEKTWITLNDIDKLTVKLNRYTDGWQPLNTTFWDENSTHVIYQASTPGFSLFAVTGEKNASAYPMETRDYYLPAAIAVTAFAIVGGYLYYRKPKTKSAADTATVVPAA